MLVMQKNIDNILRSVDHIEKLNGTRKQITVKYVPSEMRLKALKADYYVGYELFLKGEINERPF